MRKNPIQWQNSNAFFSKNKSEGVRVDLGLGDTYTSVTVAGAHRSLLEASLEAPGGEMIFFENDFADDEADGDDRSRLKIESLGGPVDISIVRDAYTITAHFSRGEAVNLLDFLREELPERLRD